MHPLKMVNFETSPSFSSHSFLKFEFPPWTKENFCIENTVEIAVFLWNHSSQMKQACFDEKTFSKNCSTFPHCHSLQ